MFKVLRHPDARRFFLAHAQSQLGTGAAYVALVLIAYHRLHSGWGVALVLLADFLPAIALGALFGALADRHSRRRLALWAELLRAAAFVALALTGSFAATVALALAAGVGTALFRPAVNAALPTIVPPSERSAATALYSGLINLGVTVGPAACALVLLVGPPTWILMADAATFAVSAALLVGVPLDAREPQEPAESEQPGEPAGSAVRAGARYAAQRPGVAAVLSIGALSALTGALINVAEPLLAVGPLHAGSSGFSILIAAFGIGMVAGSLANARLTSDVRSLRRWFLAGVAANGVAMVACGGAASFGWALPAFALAGLTNVLILGPQVRLLQELVADRFRGRVFGLRDAAESAAFALAFVAAGGLLSVAGPRAVYLLSGTLLIALGAAGPLAFRLGPAASVEPDGAQPPVLADLASAAEAA